MNELNLNGRLARQRGVALIVVLVVLLIVTLLGLSTVNSTLLDAQVAGNASETHTSFQAAETLLAQTRNSPANTFSNAITIAPTTLSISVPSTITDKFAGTTMGSTLNYVGEGTVAFGSSIGKFKPQQFRSRGTVSRNNSGASATHAQGIVVLSPGF
jgi:type IV pilus assembly protein PilX